MRPFFCGKREMSRLRNSVKSDVNELANRPMTDFLKKSGFGRLAAAFGVLFFGKRGFGRLATAFGVLFFEKSGSDGRKCEKTSAGSEKRHFKKRI